MADLEQGRHAAERARDAAMRELDVVRDSKAKIAALQERAEAERAQAQQEADRLKREAEDAMEWKEREREERRRAERSAQEMAELEREEAEMRMASCRYLASTPRLQRRGKEGRREGVEVSQDGKGESEEV